MRRMAAQDRRRRTYIGHRECGIRRGLDQCQLEIFRLRDSLDKHFGVACRHGARGKAQRLENLMD